MADNTIWKRSFECISCDGGAVYAGDDNTPLEKAIESGALYRRVGVNFIGEPMYTLVCVSPKFRHFEETGWLHVWRWTGSAQELVRIGIGIDNDLRSWTGGEYRNDLRVFDRRGSGRYPVTDVWTTDGRVIKRNGRHVEDPDLVFRKLGWIVRRMSQFDKHEVTMTRRDNLTETIERLGNWRWE